MIPSFPQLLLIALDPSALVVGLVLGYLVSGRAGLLLTAVVFVLVGFLTLVMAVGTFMYANSGSDSANFGFQLVLNFGAYLMWMALIKTAFAVFWAFVGQIIGRRWRGQGVTA